MPHHALSKIANCSEYGVAAKFFFITNRQQCFYAHFRRFYFKNGFSSLLQSSYDFDKVETYWKHYWDSNLYAQGKHSLDASNKNFYVLPMFPYPSGSLHIGHARVYTISDVLARAYRMKGLNVLHPIGWDAFGLPAENAAIERNIRPSTWTISNIAQMKAQMKVLGLDFDWPCELNTSDPKYYKWTQWIFLKMHQCGLAYQRESYVNWDPVDETVLANEQVDSQGRSWRSGAFVEKKLMKQWYWRITDYAEFLLKDLDNLKAWPSEVIKMQREWIGESEGYVIKFFLQNHKDSLNVFTTRLETLYGCTFLALAFDHAFVDLVTTDAQRQSVQSFAEKCKSLSYSDLDKHKPHGVFSGSYAVSPLTGQEIPIYFCNYVISDYGTGCVMGVPAHDLRDWSFAQLQDIPVKFVLHRPGESVDYTSPVALSSASLDDYVLTESGELSGKSIEDATRLISETGHKHGWIEKKKFYKLKDWLISRQRYWGTPIPIVYCQKCGVIPVPEDQLPVMLPDDEELNIKTRGSPLANAHQFCKCKCHLCGGEARRETDTMDTFVDSSFYYLRFPNYDNTDSLTVKDVSDRLLPVDIYVGGIEHAILHLLYARFVNKFLYNLGLISNEHPFHTLLTQGMIHGKTFRLQSSKKPVNSSQVNFFNGEALHATTGQSLTVTWEKMSKSKYNGVDPHETVKEYGADVTRLYLLFKAPIDQVIKWDGLQIKGQLRWLSRIWKIVQHYQLYRHYNKCSIPTHHEHVPDNERIELRSFVHRTIQSVTLSVFQNYSFNLSIASLMSLTNVISKIARASESDLLVSYDKNFLLESYEYREAIESLLLMLAPMAPHFASEVWKILHVDPHCENPSMPEIHVLTQRWPTFNPEYIKEDLVSGEQHEYTVLISGKKLKKILVDSLFTTDQQVLVEYLKNIPEIQNKLLDKEIKRVLYIERNRLINFVI